MAGFVLKDGTRVHLIGDPHLGKAFGHEQGVPIHRRGERETMMATQFADELETDADVIVMVGDLFDTPFVSDAVIVAAARAVLGAAERNEDVLYVMMAGNHDLPRNLGVVGAWHSFREMTQGRFANLRILDKPTRIDALAFFPWEWDRRADDQVSDIADLDGVEHAIGHWDLSVFDGKDAHLVPVAAFARHVGLWSGHYHKPDTYRVEGVDVNGIGSMQPYTHAEDPSDHLYVTLPLADALGRDDLHDRYVRVLLAPGEDLPEIDCLGLTHKRLRGAVEEPDEIVDFDFHQTIRDRIQHRDPLVRGFIEERMSLNATGSPE